MGQIPSNRHYFKISQQNPEPPLDLDYFIIDKEPEMKKYLNNIREIKEILITIKKLREAGESKDIIEKYYLKLFNNFNEFSNCSELGCFVNACDTTRDLIREDFTSFKTITNLFIKKRILDDKTPENWIQAIIDSNASRKKGRLGELKLIKILTGKNYQLVTNWADFEKVKKCVASFTKNTFDIKLIRERLGIAIKTSNQGKMLDLLIKNDKKILILEAKHLNTGGGEQNKQLAELIKILKLACAENISFVSFLDGTYSNKLLAASISKRSKKLYKQRREIENYLNRKQSENFWVNTAGFKQLILDL